MLVGNPPFSGKNESEVFNRIKHNRIALEGEDWEKISKETKEFLKFMLVKNPTNRPNILQVCEHEWLVATETPYSS